MEVRGDASTQIDETVTSTVEARDPVSPSQWSFEEDKLFENAMAHYDQESPDFWEDVASMLPERDPEEARKYYKLLVEIITGAKADRIELLFPGQSPGGTPNSNVCTPGAKKPANSKGPLERRKGICWTEVEHKLFLQGLEKYGKGDWKSISRYSVKSRTPTQVASHAQKYFNRQTSLSKNEQRKFPTVNGGVNGE